MQSEEHYINISFSKEAQRKGLSLIYNMAYSGYQNFDFDLAMKVLHLLKVNKVLCISLFVLEIKRRSASNENCNDQRIYVSNISLY